MNRILFSSKSPHWATPKGLYDELHREFGFTLDPCPLGESEKDGSSPLFTKWGGARVYCNPPYNRGVAQFLERAREADLAVFLLPARTDTKWFHDLCLPHASEIRFVKGRLKFGGLKHPAPFPSMIVIFKSLSADSLSSAVPLALEDSIPRIEAPAGDSSCDVLAGVRVLETADQL